MQNSNKFNANRILRAVPERERTSMEPDLHEVTFALNETVHASGAGINHVYFPTEAAFSVLKLLRDGAAIEVAAIGREGMSGVAAALDARVYVDKTIAQRPGKSFCMPIERFRDHYRRRPLFRKIVERYAQVVYYAVSQEVACNRFHSIRERCAKWLLAANDRAGETFPLTHELFSQMLGVNRPTVSLAAAALAGAGLIKYSRGVMTVLDRDGLERAACECYGSVASELERLIPG